MNRKLRDTTRHDDILAAAFREHHTDRCPDCGARNCGIVGTVAGYEVICMECGCHIREVDLDDEQPAAVRY